VPTYSTLRYLWAEDGVYFFDEHKYSFHRGEANNDIVEVTLKNGVKAGGYILLSIAEYGTSFRYPPYAIETLTLPLKNSFTKNDKLSQKMKDEILQRLTSLSTWYLTLPNKHSRELTRRKKWKIEYIIRGASKCIGIDDELIKVQAIDVKKKFTNFLEKFPPILAPRPLEVE